MPYRPASLPHGCGRARRTVDRRLDFRQDAGLTRSQEARTEAPPAEGAEPMVGVLIEPNKNDRPRHKLSLLTLITLSRYDCIHDATAPSVQTTPCSQDRPSPMRRGIPRHPPFA